MNKIKVVSNPYEKTVTFSRYDLSSESWITINSENNSNSKLVSAVFQRGFFPFKVYDILKEIENEYSVPDEKLEIIFEGPNDEKQQLEEALKDERFSNIILSSSTSYLENARDVLPEINRIFRNLEPLNIKNIGESNKEIEAQLKRFSDASGDTVPICVLGTYSAGKSTFIRLLYREVKHDKGSLKVADFDLDKIKKRDIPMLRRNVGVVFQDYKLLPKKTVYENIAYAMQVIGERRRNIKKRVMEVLDLVGLKHKVRSFPNELSGGEQQRIAIARAIVNNPKVLIADEPTGNLDPDNSWEIMNLLERINLQGTTVLMATHNSQIVNTLRHRVIAIENGRVVRDEAEGEYGYDD